MRRIEANIFFLKQNEFRKFFLYKMLFIGITAPCALKKICISRIRVCNFERNLDNPKSLFTLNVYYIIKQPYYILYMNAIKGLVYMYMLIYKFVNKEF